MLTVSGWRQARAIALLPGTVLVIVPAAILIAAVLWVITAIFRYARM